MAPSADATPTDLEVTGQLLVDGNAYFKSGRPWYDVCAYGAVGDGLADDTAAIQSVLDEIPDGSNVYFPPGTYVVTPSDPTNFIRKIRTINIAVFDHSRETSTIVVKAASGNYVGVLGTMVLRPNRSEGSNIAFDHNQQNNPQASQAEYSAHGRYSVAAWPPTAWTTSTNAVSIRGIDVINSDSVVNIYFPQDTIRNTDFSVVYCRFLNLNSQASVDYDQSIINVAGENVLITGCMFDGLTWSKPLQTAIEVYAQNIAVTTNVINRFQTGLT